MTTYYKASGEDFRRWLHQPIWLNDCEEGYRYEYIPVLHEHITRWMKTLGYSMGPTWSSRILARWMYGIHIQEIARKDHWASLTYPPVEHRDWLEDRDYFNLHVNHDSITHCLRTWVTCEDLDPESVVGERFHLELEKLLYVYVDLENSKRGKVIAKQCVDSESESDTNEAKRRKEDTYIQDAREGYHGGGWSKV